MFHKHVVHFILCVLILISLSRAPAYFNAVSLGKFPTSKLSSYHIVFMIWMTSFQTSRYIEKSPEFAYGPLLYFLAFCATRPMRRKMMMMMMMMMMITIIITIIIISTIITTILLSCSRPRTSIQ